MGFIKGLMDFTGDMVGRMAAMAEEVQQYKLEYESLSDNDLKRKYLSLRERNDKTSSRRKQALKMIMQDRGMIKSQQD